MNLIESLKMSEEKLIRRFALMSNEFGFQYDIGKGYLWIKGESNICLVAHTDTSLEVMPDHIQEENGLIKGYIKDIQCGIGADDRVGCYIAYDQMQYKSHLAPHILLVSGEETDDEGVLAFINANPDLKGIDLFLDLDSHGCGEYTWYGDLPNPACKFVEQFGFIDSECGYMSTISILQDYYGTPAVNLSVGYFNEHYTNEYIDIDAVALTKKKLNRILGHGFIKEINE
jgi:hypothetical protein